MEEKLGIAGGGAIACGLAAVASQFGDVMMWTRSPESAERARTSIEKVCGKLEGVDASRVDITTELGALGGATAIIEAVVEELDVKTPLLRDIAGVAADGALLGSTTSSLSVQALADASGRQQDFVGLHVFNPVPRMELVELAFPAEASDGTRARAVRLCEDLGKTPVVVPDTPGFVVNRLLFPYLFSAVFFLEESGMPAADVDRCMTMGAGHPMGPLALLDFVGLDVSLAIGETIGTQIPERVRTLVAEGALGKKSGRGFYDYSKPRA